MLARPPCSTPFPYTTLFRSDAARSVADEVRALGADAALVCCDVSDREACRAELSREIAERGPFWGAVHNAGVHADAARSEEHTSELQSLRHLVCRLLLEKKK